MGAGSAISKDSTHAWHGTSALKVVTQGTAWNEGTVTPTGTAGLAVTAGETYTASFYAYAEAAAQDKIYFTIWWYNASGSFLSASESPNTTLVQNAWTRYTVSGVAPAGAAFAAVGVNRKNPYAATWWLDGIQFEVGTSASAFRASPASEFQAGPATDFNSGLATTFFHYDGINVVAETDAAGAVTASYLYDDAGQPISMTRGGQTYFYQTNAHGDVVALANGAGTVVNTYSYDPWGKVLSAAEQVVNPYRYAGYRYDAGTGLYYLWNRYYSPGVRRFLTVDPVGGSLERTQSINSYLYAQARPTRYRDPTGLYVDIALDIGFLLYDIEQIRRDGTDNLAENLLWTAGDGISILLPVVSASVVRAGRLSHGLGVAEDWASLVARGGVGEVDIGRLVAEAEAQYGHGIYKVSDSRVPSWSIGAESRCASPTSSESTRSMQTNSLVLRKELFSGESRAKSCLPQMTLAYRW